MIRGFGISGIYIIYSIFMLLMIYLLHQIFEDFARRFGEIFALFKSPL